MEIIKHKIGNTFRIVHYTVGVRCWGFLLKGFHCIFIWKACGYQQWLVRVISMDPLHFAPIHVCVSAFTVCSSIFVPILLVILMASSYNKSSDHMFFILLWLGTVDVNECTNGTDRCHSRATCHNTQGSYTCSCNSGYIGNGFSCTGKYIDI